MPLRSLSREQWEAVARKSFERFGEVELTDRAAALAYYGFLSLFPALIVAVALLALFGSYPETYDSIIDTLRDAAPGEAVDTIDSALKNVLQGRGAGGTAGVRPAVRLHHRVGRGRRRDPRARGDQRDPRVGSFMRSFVRSNLTRLWLTLALMALMLIAVGRAAGRRAVLRLDRRVGGAGRHAAASWCSCCATRSASRRCWRRSCCSTRWGRRARGAAWSSICPGALLAAVLWVLASVAFSFYVDNFGSYDKTYGALGAVIVLLIWIYVGARGAAAGALVNRELTRVR